MPDYGAVVADKAIEQATRKLKRIYKQAAKELQEGFADFKRKHAAKQLEKLAQLNKGEITQAEYQSWMRGQVFIGDQWKAKIDQAARIMNSANEQAASIVNTGKMNVFAENYNYEAFQLEKRAKGAANFNLFDDDSVARLVRDKPKMLPEWKIDHEKDYIWNRQKVENSITQGIIQGKGIDEITDDLVNRLCTTNNNKMRTFARTAMTGAQNAGRQQNAEDAEDMGIKVKKRWVATLDSRTRDTHQELDGQEVPVNEPFVVDGMEIMYPGDPSAEPELVYNCRCTMIEVYDGIDRTSVRRAYDDDETGTRDSYTVENMTYKEWKEWKESGKPEQEKPEPKQKQKEEKKPTVINGMQVDENGRLVVDDAKIIEENRKENDELEKMIKENTEAQKECWEEYNRLNDEARELRRDYASGKITEDEYDRRRDAISSARAEKANKAEELLKENTKMRTEQETFNSARLVDAAKSKGVAYDPPKVRETPRTAEEIAAVVGGGDMTSGSCASLGFCYVGQTEGIDVLDFRDGESRKLFSYNCRETLRGISKEMGKPLLTAETKTGAGGAIRLAKQMQDGKEYYFVAARHASIMRQNNGVIEYYELQHATSNGWKTFGKADDRSTLEFMFRWRFGASSHISGKAMMMDIEDMKGSKVLQRVYGYINTAAGAQHKGGSGNVK